MRNRAKCKLCATIIESMHPTDYVECKCGEISVEGGASLKCAARNYDNFLRVDDVDNEIQVKTKSDENVLSYDQENKIIKEKYDDAKSDSLTDRKKKLFTMLTDMIKTYEELPPEALQSNVSHYDLLSFMMIVAELLRSDNS